MEPILENTCSYPSGYVTIEDNSANWIHTAITYESDSALTIHGNKLNAYDERYLTRSFDTLGPYFDGIPSTTNCAAIFVGSNKPVPNGHSDPIGPDAACIISNNTTNTGLYWIDAGNDKTFTYDLAVIHTTTSAIITNNILKGVSRNSAGSPVNVVILLQGFNNKVSANRLYREEKTISYYAAYIPFGSDQFTYGKGFITENYLDSPHVDSVTKSETVFNSNEAFVTLEDSARWVIERNVNQTAYQALPITNSQLFAYGNKGIEQAEPFSPEYFITAANDDSGGGFEDDSNVNKFKSFVTRVHDWSPEDVEEEGFTERNFGWQESLDKYLPKGVKIIGMEIGVRTFGVTFIMPNIDLPENTETKFSLYLNKFKQTRGYTNLNYFDTAASADDYIIDDNTSPQASLDGNQLNVTGLTQYLSINLEDYESSGDITDDYINLGRPLGASLKIKYKKQALRTDFLLSPLVVKYRW